VNSKLKYILPLCIIPAVVPHENIVAPALRLRVIDETDNPISGIVVKQSGSIWHRLESPLRICDH